MLAQETVIDLLRSPGHWMFEGVTDLVFAGVGAFFARFWVRAHDRKHHDK